MKNKSKDNKPIKKISRFSYLMISLNYIIGITFIMILSSAINYVGWWIIPIIIFAGIVSYFVGLNFATLNQKFYGAYGSVYLSCREAFGRKGGFLIAWIQYLISPIISMIVVSGIVWCFQDIKFDGINLLDDKYRWIVVLCTALLFFALVIILNLGFNATTIGLLIIAIFKWLIILIATCAAIFLFFKYVFLDITKLKENFHFDSIKSKNFPQVMSVIVTLFTCFGGLEGIVTISGDVKTTKSKNPVKFTLLWTVIIATLIYIIWIILFASVLGKEILPGGSSSQSSINPITRVIQLVLPISSGILFSLFLLISQIANKAVTRLQTGWSTTRNIVALAADGILPRKLLSLGKHNQFNKSIWLDSIISFIFVGIFCTSVLLSSGVAKDLVSTLNSYAFCIFSIYSLSFVASLKLCKNKKLLLSKKLRITILLCLVNYLILGIIYICSIFYQFIIDLKLGNFSMALPTILPLATFLLGIIIGYIIYFISEKKKWIDTPFPDSWKQHVKNNPELIFPESL